MKFLIVYGPTREPLDPVRFLSNYSTGVMGKALVEAADAGGHRVDCVECPRDAESAADLLRVLKKRIAAAEVFVMAAAVCDVRPAELSRRKIKKTALGTVRLVKNPDILEALAEKKRRGQIFVGFALESEALLKNARRKMRAKNLDMIVAQPVTAEKSPFGKNRLEASVIGRRGVLKHFASVSKRALAGFLVREAEKLLARWPRS